MCIRDRTKFVSIVLLSLFRMPAYRWQSLSLLCCCRRFCLNNYLLYFIWTFFFRFIAITQELDKLLSCKPIYFFPATFYYFYFMQNVYTFSPVSYTHLCMVVQLQATCEFSVWNTQKCNINIKMFVIIYITNWSRPNCQTIT